MGEKEIKLLLLEDSPRLDSPTTPHNTSANLYFSWSKPVIPAGFWVSQISVFPNDRISSPQKTSNWEIKDGIKGWKRQNWTKQCDFESDIFPEELHQSVSDQINFYFIINDHHQKKSTSLDSIYFRLQRMLLQSTSLTFQLFSIYFEFSKFWDLL